MKMMPSNNSQFGLTPEQKNEIIQIGIEFAFEDGLTVENYKRQYLHVPEEVEIGLFLEGYNKAKMELAATTTINESKHLK